MPLSREILRSPFYCLASLGISQGSKTSIFPIPYAFSTPVTESWYKNICLIAQGYYFIWYIFYTKQIHSLVYQTCIVLKRYIVWYSKRVLFGIPNNTLKIILYFHILHLIYSHRIPKFPSSGFYHPDLLLKTLPNSGSYHRE